MSRRIPLTEKYRPRSLDEIVGQDKVVKAIRNLLERGLHTNLLFVGRCSLFQFGPITDGDVLRRLHAICKSEGLIQSKFPAKAREALKALVRHANGDMRKALNTLEKYISGDQIEYVSMKNELVFR